MLGDIFSSPRDMAVNESAQQRVSDSGAIRSGLVPRQHDRYRQAIACMPRTGKAWRPLAEQGLRPQDLRRRHLGHCNRRISRTGEGADARGDSEAETDPVFLRCHGERGRAALGAGILRDCVGAEHHYLCGGEASHDDCNQSTPGHAKDVPFASNDGFEIRVCPTWWKRVSWLSEMHARLRAPA